MDASSYISKHWARKEVWRNLASPKHQARFRSCVSFLEGQTFADVGCGLGHSTDYMRRMKDGEWTGIDFSTDAIEQARENFTGMDFLCVYSIQDLVGVFYDGVVCSEVIEHVEWDRKFILGVWSLTRKAMVVTTPNKHVNDPGHLRVYTEEMLEDLFTGIPHVIESKGPFWYIVCRRN